MHCSFDVDTRAIRFNASQAVAANGLYAAPLHFVCDMTEMHSRLTINPLLRETAVIDPNGVTVPFEVLIRKICPLFSQ
jgi:hypothetical protein